jgi:hypothetical protein
MKIKQIINLIVGITSVALSPMTWAAGHVGGGGGGFGGGGHFAGGAGFRGGGVGFHSASPRFSGRRRSIAGPRFSGSRRGITNEAARQSGTFERSGFTRRMGAHIAERHNVNWHRDWDRRRAHFDHNRFFVFIDGFWCGLDAGFFPWDYYPYYAYEYYPYDDYASYYDSTVNDVQGELAQLGYYKGPIDGIYGQLTRDAVAKYQIAKKLDVSGNLSAQTLRSLGLPQPTAS